MPDKELLQKLNRLNCIKADSGWKKKSREILMSQISGSDFKKESEVSDTGIAQALSFSWLRRVTQPTMAAFLIVIFILGSGVISLRAARDTKPGDSFYIAKILNEKAHQVFTFNKEEKARLGLEFAGNRAEELTQVLAEPGNGDKEEKVEKLVNNFKKEISAAKIRIEKIYSKTQAKESFEEEIIIEEAVEEEDTQVFSANAVKDENGIQISEQEPAVSEEEAVEEPEEPEAEALSSTTPELAEVASSTEGEAVEAVDVSYLDPQSLLDEAAELLDNKDYDATISKLEEAGEVISQVDTGDVKGDFATSSDELDIEPVEDEGQVLGAEEATTTINH